MREPDPLRQPNAKLRRQRQLRGWSWDEVTEELSKLAARDGHMGPDRNTYGRWERGVRRPQPRNVRLLCDLFELPADELGLVAEEESSPPQLVEASVGYADAAGPLVIHVSGDGEVLTVTMNRREFLEVLGSGTGAIVLHWQPKSCPAVRVDSSVSHLDRSVAAQAHGQAIAAAWTIFHTASPAQVLAIGRSQLTLLGQHHHLLDHGGLLPTFYSALYRLIGATYQRQGRYQDAIREHHKAYLAALEGGDAWQMAESRSWQAYGMTALGDHAESLQAIEAALRLLSQRTDPESIRLQARLLSSAANAAAALGDAKQADARLYASEALLDQLPGLHEEFDRVAWLESAGVCALRLGRLELATDTLQQALAEVPVQWVARHVFTTIALSTVLARRRDLEAALTVAGVALSPLKAARSHELTGHFFGFLHNELLPGFPGNRRSQAFADEAEQTIAVDV